MPLEDYFRIVSRDAQVLHFELTGFWSEEVVAEIREPFLGTFREAVDGFRGRPFLILADLSGLSVLPPAGKVLVADTMAYAMERGLHRAIDVLPKVVTKLSVEGAAGQTGQGDFRTVVSSLEEATALLSELRREL